jgi:hypothetical protein
MDHQVASYLQDVASLKTPVTADDEDVNRLIRDAQFLCRSRGIGYDSDRSHYLGSLDTL